MKPIVIGSDVSSGTTGELLHELTNPNNYSIKANDNFGKTVSICESYSIVGATGEDDASGTTSGVVYIFDNASGVLLYTLDNPNDYGTSDNDYFGYSVAITGSYCIAGAYDEDESWVFPEDVVGSGRAYIFN